MRFYSLILCLISVMAAKAQLPKWILGSSEQDASGNFYSYGTGNLKFYEVNFKGGLSSTPRTIGTSIQNIKSMGTQDVMQTAVDTTTNTVLFYVFAAATGAWNNGFPAISPDTMYFAAYNSSTGADEIFGKVPSTGWGASVIESELVQKPGLTTEYYFIYKTQATSNYLDYIRYVTVDIVNKTVSTPTNLVTTEKSGEGMAVSQLNCSNQRWLFVTRPESNGDITLRRCTISNLGITPAVDTYTISIPGNSTGVVVGVEIAPTNNYLAVANYNNTSVNKNMILFDYNNNTGSVSNERYYHNQSNYPFVTMEFSPNGSRVYILQGGSGSVPNVIYNCPVSSTNFTVTAANQMSSLTLNQSLTLEAAYDGNIYVNPGQSSNFMYIINNPNSASPSVSATSNTFFGSNDRMGSGFPDQVDGDKYAKGPVNVSIAASGTAICSGQTTTLTASGGSTYQWSGGSTATTSVITVTPSSTTNYTVVASNGTCTSTPVVVTVSVTPSPTLTIVATNTLICAGQTTTLTASGSSNYQWSGGSTATTSVISVNPANTTTYVVSGTNGTCTSSDSVVVQVVSSPTAAISGNLNICAGQTTTLTASGGTSYQWSGGSTATTSVITVSPAVTTDYSVIATVGTCTSNPEAITVNVTANPTVSITRSDSTICAAQSVTLTASGGASYQWSGGISSTSSTVVVTPATTTNYIVTASNGTCTASSATTVSVAPSPTITVVPSNSIICSGQSATLTASGGTSYQWSGGSTSTSSVITVNPAATNTYVVTVSNGTCTTLDSATIQVNQTPTVTATGTFGICPGQTTTLSASGGTAYQWSGGSTATTSVILVSPATTTDYTVVTSNGGCTSVPTVVTVTVLPTPTITIVSSATSICTGQSATISATGGTSYQWSGGSSSVNDTIFVSPANTTTYVLAVSNGTCTAADSITLQVNSTPTVNISGNQTICSGQTTTLTATGASAYQWSGGSTATTSVIIVSPTANTDYTVNSFNGNCPGNPAAVTVTVTATPTISVSSTPTICAGQSATLTATGASSYQWSNGISDTTSTVIVSPGGTTTYTVLSVNGNCTSAPAITTVSVTPNPTLTIVATSTSICSGQSATLTATGANGYQWSGGSTSTASVIVVNPGATTNYTVNGSSNGCNGATTSITLSVTPTPTVTVVGTQTICSGQSATLTASGASSYQWSGGSSSTSSVIVVNPTQPTTYIVTGSNGNCPGTPGSATVTVLTTPVLSINGNQNICSGQSTTLTASGATNYQWSGGSTATTATIVTSPTVTTNYTVSGSSNGCPANPLAVTVNVTTTPTVAAGANQNICSGQAATLTATGGNSYQWSGSASTASVITVNPALTTSYTVTTSTGNCVSLPAIITVSVTPSPSLAILSSSAFLCSGQSTTLTATGGSSYQWSGGNTSTSSVIVVTPTVTTSYAVTSAIGSCIDTASVSIPVLPFVQAAFEWEMSNCTPPTVMFTNLSPAGVVWNFGDGNQSNTNNPVHSYANGTYSAYMITNAGTACADTNTQSITVLYHEVPIIPNIFTPNGDGINDDLIFRGLDNCSEYHLTIFNRWGQKVFETSSPQTIFWNGTLNGKTADDDTYFFILEPTNSNERPIKGYVTVIR